MQCTMRTHPPAIATPLHFTSLHLPYCARWNYLWKGCIFQSKFGLHSKVSQDSWSSSVKYVLEVPRTRLHFLFSNKGALKFINRLMLWIIYHAPITVISSYKRFYILIQITNIIYFSNVYFQFILLELHLYCLVTN